jgi:two-component system response regulator HydG
MSQAGQAKILRAVEYGEFERLGSEALEHADVRLISATHLPLHRYLETDHFRKDLFYRISGITLRLPALRERPHDLRTIVGTAIVAAAEVQGKEIVGLDRAAAETLFTYEWPGNLRQLQRVIHTAVAITEGTVIGREALLLEGSVDGMKAETAEKGGAGRRGADEGGGEDLSLRGAEVRHIRSVLERFKGNKRRTAKALGLSRSTLDRRLGER